MRGRIKRLEKLARPCRACAIRETRGYEIEWVEDLDEGNAGEGFECEECGTWIEDLTVTWSENLPPANPEPRPWARFE